MDNLRLTSLLLSLIFHTTTTNASPIPTLLPFTPTKIHSQTRTMVRRSLTTGSKAGLGIGIAVAAILLILVSILLILHFRRHARIAAFDAERAAVSQGTKKQKKKNQSASSTGTATATTVTNDKDLELEPKQPEPQVTSFPRRQKSIRDRLMGPLYRDQDPVSMPMPARVRKSKIGGAGAQGGDANDSDNDLVGPGNMSKRSTVYSFSSRRATRMMMMM